MSVSDYVIDQIQQRATELRVLSTPMITEAEAERLATEEFIASGKITPGDTVPLSDAPATNRAPKDTQAKQATVDDALANNIPLNTKSSDGKGYVFADALEHLAYLSKPIQPVLDWLKPLITSTPTDDTPPTIRIAEPSADDSGGGANDAPAPVGKPFLRVVKNAEPEPVKQSLPLLYTDTTVRSSRAVNLGDEFRGSPATETWKADQKKKWR